MKLWIKTFLITMAIGIIIFGGIKLFKQKQEVRVMGNLGINMTGIIMPKGENISFSNTLNTSNGNQVGFTNNSIVLGLFDKENITFTLPATNNSYASLSNTLERDFGQTSMKWYIDKEGNFEWEIILKQKPLTNIITIPVQTKEYNWFYQPPLNQEHNNYTNCNETDCWNLSEDIINAHRPTNVVNSYAVYSKDKRNNQYQTGKIFHLYRPFLIDASNKTTWASYNENVSSSGSLIITLPQKFLDTATYPVIIDPTFGYTTLGGSYGEHAGPALRILTNYTPASNGIVKNMSVDFGGTTTSATVRPVMYEWNGTGYNLTTNGSEMAKEVNVFNNQTVTNVPVYSSKLYGVGFWYSNTQDFAYDSGARILRRANPGYSSTADPPLAFVQAAAITAREYSVYVTYDVSGEPPAGNCWTNDGSKIYIPNGCKYYTVTGDYT